MDADASETPQPGLEAQRSGESRNASASPDSLALFESHRRALKALAYRMLGSVGDAEDIVQDCWLRWHRTPTATIDNPGAWLRRVCARLCVDHLRRRERERANYVGPWLPEPVLDVSSVLPSEAVSPPPLADSLRLGFLLLLERLTPTERAAFLLREVFDAPYDEIAAALQTNEAACRQLVSRARRHLAEERQRFAPAPGEEWQLAKRFSAAIEHGDLTSLIGMLTPSAELHSDGGGKALAALNVIRGADRVARFLIGTRRKNRDGATWQLCMVNGGPGLIGVVSGRIVTVATLECSPSEVEKVLLVRNPDKLDHIAATLSVRPLP